MKFILPFLLLSLGIATAQEKTQAELEAGFTAMLRDATLQGSWIPIRDGATGTEKSDGYRIARVEKIEDDTWRVVSNIKFKGRDIEYPMPVTVKWAGDVAVMILDEVRAGSGKKYSARVMYHKDRYAGSWWSTTQAGGLLSGTIKRDKTQ